MTDVLERILLFSILALAGCEAHQASWGEREFVLDQLREWDRPATIRACALDDERAIYLFQNDNQFYMITKNNDTFDIAHIITTGDNIEIEANGGIGRYAEIQNRFLSIEVLPERSIEISDYEAEIVSTPNIECP